MPSKNRIKVYIDNGFYHIYNRGVEKRDIFLDEVDYSVFLRYLKEALAQPPQIQKKVLKTIFDGEGRSFYAFEKPPKNFCNHIVLNCYCLMPNHFHLLIKQHEKNDMESFMRSVITRYVRYFNKKYDRVGPLFQGRYKAVMINDERYLLHLSRYIHLNPAEFTKDLTTAYSSYSDFLGLRKTSWIDPHIILSYFNQKASTDFKNVNTYQKFVEGYEKDSGEILGRLTLED